MAGNCVVPFSALVFFTISRYEHGITQPPLARVLERGLCSRHPLSAGAIVAQPPSSSAVRNGLLAALPPENLAQLLPKLHAVSLPLKKTLLVPQGRIEAVHFIESGWASVVAQLNDGTQAEVGLVGREGIVGLSLLGGVDTAFAETYMQAGGTGLRMEATAFQRELEDNLDLRRRLFRYNEAMHAQTAQTAACNGRHDLEPRLAKWLLMAHDRSDGDELSITQEFLSLMLCVYRPSVTVVAGILQRAGMIRYSKGSITILDRDALEATACDCYQTVQDRFKYLLG
jgi:CRP-like cAMP-binding protein